jgi:mycothione reductase
MKQYDLIIIGTGGGTKLRPAADLGKKIAIIEKSDLGGTCLNRGCLPSKMLIYPADLITHIREIQKFDIQVNQDIQVDFPKLIKRVIETIIKDSESIKAQYQKHPNIDLYQGHARFKSNKVVVVNNEELQAEKIYIGTGSRPHIPDIPGLHGTPYMTSQEALRNLKQPKKMIIIGGGYIAVELGHFYGACGTEVHFLVRNRLLSHEDHEVIDAFEKDFSSRYNVHFSVVPQKVEYKDDGFSVEVLDKNNDVTVMQADALFVATGVIPNSDDLGLQNTDIRMDKHGYISSNDHLETGVDGVYVLGDVAGKFLFRHSVNFEGEYLLRQHFLQEERMALKYPPMPHAVFTYPQIAAVGKTENQLKEEGLVKGQDYVVGINDYKNSAFGMAMLPDTGFVKILVHRVTHKILGVHIIGEQAANLIHPLIAYMTLDATIDKTLDMIYIHPAMPEMLKSASRKIMAQL